MERSQSIDQSEEEDTMWADPGLKSILDDPILSSEGKITTIRCCTAVIIVDDVANDEQIGAETVAGRSRRSEEAVSEPHCNNCDREWHQCLSGMPVHQNERLSDLVPFSVISCGPHWQKKRRGHAATILEVLDQNGLEEATNGRRVKIRWTQKKKKKTEQTFFHFVTNSNFNFNCGNCSNCGLPKRRCRNGTALTSIAEIVEGKGFRVEAVGSFWAEMERGRKGRVVQLCLEDGALAVHVVWDDQPKSAKPFHYKLISSSPHGQDTHIFSVSCF